MVTNGAIRIGPFVAEARTRVTRYNEILALMAQIPHAMVKWFSDDPGRVVINWLHNPLKAEWGYVTMFSNLDWAEGHKESIKTLQFEVRRYQANERYRNRVEASDHH